MASIQGAPCEIPWFMLLREGPGPFAFKAGVPTDAAGHFWQPLCPPIIFSKMTLVIR